MNLTLTPKTLRGLTLGIGAIGLQVVALKLLAEGTSDLATQRDALGMIVGKHADTLDNLDRETLRKMGIAIKSKTLDSGG